MALDPRLLDILVCPHCRGSVTYKDRRKLIVCESCDRRYPVRENIPIMLDDE